ncbi:PspC domain-containing protein [Kineococcus sp. R8]|uniref:PspC domain-containing protein n=1 Tax=Kineococcus siccus TaxID=2696567 RepID=UPI001411BD3C|nr:PspC domain-containing protein [Kineococcus siccus]NAZ82442.1 PspC domain-containing protein [Kineococcus siccus]
MPTDDTSSASSSGPSAATADRFFAAVRAWGAVRPVEPGQRRWLAGVCGALATRWNADPLLVRGGFVLLTLLGGVGLALYGLAWALLPDARGRLEAESAVRGDVSAALVLATALVVVDLVAGHGLLGLDLQL